MTGTQPPPGTIQESGEKKPRRRVGDLLSKQWWQGIAAIAGVAALVITGLAIFLPAPQHAAAAPIRFTDLDEVTLYNEGVVLSYPSGWNLQGGLGAHPIESGDGPRYVNPNDGAVSIQVVGSQKNGGPRGPALEYYPRDVTTSDVKALALSEVSAPGIRIIASTESGVAEEDAGQRYPVDAWQATYQLTDYQSKRSMTVVSTTAISEGRAVKLIMEAPTSEFPRYKEAFLELSGKMLLLTKCFLCFTQ